MTKIVKEFTIRCGDCSTPLAVINEYKTGNVSREFVRTQYRMKECYKCGGSSFWTPIFELHTAIQPPNDKIEVKSHSHVYEKDENLMKAEFITRKKS